MKDLTFTTLAAHASNIVVLVAFVFALLLLIKSLIDFSQTGPQLRNEVLAHYRFYLAMSLVRLFFGAFLLSFCLALPGSIAYLMGVVILDYSYSALWVAATAIASIATLTILQFCRILLESPGVIVASSHYAMSRFYGLWERLSPARIKYASVFLLAVYVIWIGLGIIALYRTNAIWASLILTLIHCAAFIGFRYLIAEPEPSPLKSAPPRKSPNILMIGSDTLRADRLGFAGYKRNLTPNIDKLAASGAVLSQCYVPCARTAPSLLSLLTGTWPHTHQVRDNFIDDAQAQLERAGLPQALAQAGYRTAALGDWAGADLGKFDLGFQELDVPEDQWNLRFFLRQGPKDIRLFLSLFVRNRIGKYLLEEIYYLAGVPLTRQIGRRARQMLHDLGQGEQPFLLNVFMASTHPPFASEYPYYTLYSDPDYRGPSKFAMSRLTDPFEIIQRQGEPREEFDLDQIIDLYDGCVKSFDDEVGHILEYLERSNLTKDTLVVIYSDHGMEFFEHETWGQGNSAVGDFSARVPIILSGPPIKAPCRLDCVTRTIDILPTLLELIGLPPASNADGVSLAQAMRGGVPPDLPAFYETGIWLTNTPGMPADHLRYPDLLKLLEVPVKQSGTLAIKAEYQDMIIAAKDRMIRRGSWKLVYQPLEQSHKLQLFHLASDPDCRLDVADKYPDVTSMLWDELQNWIRTDRACAIRLCKIGTTDYGASQSGPVAEQFGQKPFGCRSSPVQ